MKSFILFDGGGNMSARKRLFFPLLFCLLIFSSCSQSQEDQEYLRFQTQIDGPFDTLTILVGFAQSEEEFAHYVDIIFSNLIKLHDLYDIFNAYEGINNLYTINANAGLSPVPVAPEIISMLQAAQEAYAITNGITNAAMGAVLRVWHEYRSHGLRHPEQATLPPMEVLHQMAQHISMSQVIIDDMAGTVFLQNPYLSLDVGAVAKGYAVDLAMDAAVEAGMRSGLISVGGHVVARGRPLDGRDYWGIAIQDPEAGPGLSQEFVDNVFFTDATLSISGTYQRFYQVDGLIFNHIINPTTLMPADLYMQVAVIHPVSWMADILSTALFILPQEEGEALVLTHGGEALWIDNDGHWFATDGYIRISSALAAFRNNTE